MGLITNPFLTSNIYTVIKTYKVYVTFIYKILIDLSESSKITWFNDLCDQIKEVKVMEKRKKK